MRLLIAGGGLHPFAIGGYASLNYNIARFLSMEPEDEVSLWGTLPIGSRVRIPERVYPARLRLGYLETPGESQGLVDALVSHVYFTGKMAGSWFDVVHFDIWPGLRGAFLLRMAKRRASKVVFLMPDILPFGARSYTKGLTGKLASWLNWSLLKRSFDLFDAVICPSRFMAGVLLNLGFVGDRIFVLPLGVDVERIRNISRTRHEAPPFILCVGPFMPIKGQHRLIEAFAKSRSRRYADLVFVGSGTYSGKSTEYRTNCIELARRLDLHNVKFMPTAPFEKWISMAKNAVMCVIPSDYESFSQLALEVMACGRPLVATKFGGIQEYLVDGLNGILVDPKDTTALADAMDSLFFDGRRRKSMGESAMKTASSLDWRVIIGRYRVLYKELTGAPESGRNRR